MTAVREIAFRRRSEANLAEEQERLKITLSSIADAVITTDADTRITYINAAGETLLSQVLNDIKSRRLDEVMTLTQPNTSKAAPNLVGQSILHVKAFRRETACVLHRPDGVPCYVRDVVSPVLDSQGFITGIVVVLQDASADVERAQDLNHRASHDVLTGLANRFEFHRRLKEVFDRATRLDLTAAVLAIDLDRFKAVNDTGGHAAGDAVLRRVAEILRVTVRQSDIVARLGGDEFAVILPNCPQARGSMLGQKLLKALNPLETAWEESSYTVGASIGLAVIAAHFKEPAEWLAAADRACYQAKNAGRGQLSSAQSTPAEDQG
jgi:diguanylate cyclase (GGDEF)-like protein/PAS domain S-box-containing protein